MARNKYPQEAKAEGGSKIKLRNPLTPQNFAQELYIESLRNKPVTISNGPAGSGKTYLVTGVALEKLLSKEVDKIVFTRPVVEADESLGFLPGTLEQKLDPYLKPLFDAVQDHVGPTMAKKILEGGHIEIAPLAFMRGRTFNHAYVVLDEAQNATSKQMKMFLTRMGYGSFFSINGDISQSDLTIPRDVPKDQWEHGLSYVIRKCAGKSENISYIEFHNKDVVRSDMCREILTFLDAPEDRRVAAIDREKPLQRRHSFSEPALFNTGTDD